MQPIAKRRIALLRSISRPTDAIAALVELLDMSPTDAEAWAELSELYYNQNLFPQAMFSLEEVLLITPNAWNIHARMGEIIYTSGLAVQPPNESHMERKLIDAMRSFCRSVELCEDYLRGFYGLKLVSGSRHELIENHSLTDHFGPRPLVGFSRFWQGVIPRRSVFDVKTSQHHR